MHSKRLLDIAETEAEVSAIRSSGPGGQNVNKVATAIQLRFDIVNSSLPTDMKKRLLLSHDRRISSEGVITIKAQRFRSQEKNRQDAFSRLLLLFGKAMLVQKKRLPSSVPRGVKEKRLQDKKRAGARKLTRRAPGEND